MKRCRECGNEVPKGRTQFCSRECSKKWHNNRDNVARVRTVEYYKTRERKQEQKIKPKLCMCGCGLEVRKVSEHATRIPLFASAECRQRHITREAKKAKKPLAGCSFEMAQKIVDLLRRDTEALTMFIDIGGAAWLA